ncbi:pyrroline-5-carboxylate reductase dimerization domain-containing protein [Effusibacillus lacus]|uniref:Late competence protein ComER n=1 Tax=Effusibacillus lacus TaxID=1348429 RepID=A0A292YPE2_9BACL|nr:pyrroline-5-carboxylate reductase dimerization domain-containing protein [Effusibacillus lacus]TCS74222.1 competence protein ComER [Effusibacillus lacus]GAX90781.1 late competence protein ComER [Effusibacillus lacus]
MRIGFIGTGSMGGMLVRAFVRSNLPNTDLAAYTRTMSKLDEIIRQYPNVQKADSAATLAESCNLIFLCVKAGDIRPVLEQINPQLNREKFLISINSAWSLKHLESLTPCKVIKIIPSITQEALAGVILTMYGSRVAPCDQELIETIFRSISFPVIIKEDHLRVCSDLASCGPAFFAYLLKSFSEAAAHLGEIPQETGDHLVSQMIYGLGKLLVEEKMGLEQIINRVAVPGGITEVGLQVLKSETEALFGKVLLATKEKQAHHG